MKKKLRKGRPKQKDITALVPREALQTGDLAEEFSKVIEEVEAQMNQESPDVTAIAEVASGPLDRRDKMAQLILRLEKEAEYQREEGARRYGLCRNLQKLADNLKFGFQLHMEMRGIKEIQGRMNRFKLYQNPPSVFIRDEEAIPEEFVDYDRKVNKVRIAEALKEGREVPGAILREETKRVEVK